MQNKTCPSPPKPSLDFPWFHFYLLALVRLKSHQSHNQPPTGPHRAWLFFKPSATWMHPSFPKSVNRTSCPATPPRRCFQNPNPTKIKLSELRLMEQHFQVTPQPGTPRGSKNWSTGCCRKTSAKAVAPQNGKTFRVNWAALWWKPTKDVGGKSWFFGLKGCLLVKLSKKTTFRTFTTFT